MRIEFDPDKDDANVAKHGVSLVFGAAIWADPDVVITSTVRLEDEEQRYKAIGLVGNKLWMAVYVDRDGVTRLISVRRTNDGEHRIYDRAKGRS